MVSHYINILDRFETFQQNHLQLNYFGQGDPWEINAFPNITFPALWVNTVSATPKLNDGNLIQTMEYNLNILSFDLVSKGEQNEKDVLNDTQLILIDLVKYIKANWLDVDIITDPLMTPFTENLSDWVTGWNINLTITVDLPSNYCDMAVIGATGSPASLCPEAFITNSDQSILYSVASGETYVLQDYTINIYVNGVFDQSLTQPAMTDFTLNIN
jgi:hypothetical protein